MKPAIITELQYFPPLSFFTTSFGRTYMYLDIYEIYHKMSFRNRCLIAGAEGTISLSVPLLNGRNQRVPMFDVLIAGDKNWQDQHFKSIQSAYNRSPFFDYYKDELLSIYRRPFRKLADWNLCCLRWVMEKLEWTTEIRFPEVTVPYLAEGFDDKRNQVLPKNYDQLNPVKYRQVFEERAGFLNNLSILDLLFNTGNEAKELLGDSKLR
jgi:WbqC-like protein family